MAKVYSWQISQSPVKYAYIVHPNDLTKPYIGVELTGDNLQKVIDWASTCTDTEYEAQFNKMKKICFDSNYDVKFEDVTAYINVKASCDNLRGPAGRGIKSITLYDDNIITNISTYIIEYDDGDTDTFEIRNGRDGVNGINGKDGVPGDTGISSKIIMIYTTGRDAEGNIIVPQRPVGGSYNFATNKVTYPSGWKSNDSDLLPPVWMSSRTFNSNGTTDGDWTTPMQITGEQGINGEDGDSMEFIFRLDKTEPDTDNLASENKKGSVPNGWTPSPCGITETEQTEWCSTRHLDPETGVWGTWSRATRWAQWGAAGLDGDGIQYIFIRTPKSNPPKNPTPYGYQTNGDYQKKYNEWIPTVGSKYDNLRGDEIEFKEGDELWSDDPVEVSNTFPYQWVCTRKYLKKEGDKEKTWQAYSEPALWGKYGEKGEQGIPGPVGKSGSTGIPGVGITQMYCLGTETEPFGGKEYEQNVVVSGLTGWFDAKEIPSSIIIEVNNLDDITEEDYEKNKGRVVCVITQNNNTQDIEHQYYLIENNTANALTGKILKDEDKFAVYIWCIQGSDIYSHNASADTYTITGIKWSLPFKIQGTNGLRGFTGSRGQVVYPMGVYNPNEVYRTTETKAPYVYDPSDGMYYVYNIVGAPWVGELPTGYETIKDKDDNFKYSLDGTADGPWMSDRNGETPATNYANAIKNATKPSWVRFDSFDAIYTSIGIIANGIIGSAVYNNEFMFSQQGKDKNGINVTYASDDVEFLSGYEYDNNKKQWRYKNGDYLEPTQVNPYEKNDDIFLHTFRPNVCINFATGQMWLACGKIVLGVDSANFYTNTEIDSSLTDLHDEFDGLLQGTKEAINKEVEKDLKQFKDELINDLPEIGVTDGKSEAYYGPDDPSDKWSVDTIKNRIGDIWFNSTSGTSYVFCTDSGATTIISAFSIRYPDLDDTYYWRAASIPDTLIDKIDGKAQIFILEPSADTVFHECDLWFLEKDYDTNYVFHGNVSGMTAGVCMVCLEDGTVTNDKEWYKKWGRADKYLNEAQAQNLINSNTEKLEQTLKEYVDNIKQTDGKADAYYSDDDPSSGFTDASEHIGDIWFHSVSGISYVFCDDAKGNYINSKKSGYYWRTTDIPKEIYDVVDGYAQIFIAKPQSPYHIGDLWFVEDNSYSGTTFHGGTSGITSGTCMVAMENNTGNTINYEHWAKRDSYANEATIKQIKETIDKDVIDVKLAVSAFTNEITENFNELKKQVDKKVDVYYSENDPSSDWKADDVPNKIGDMWYNTKDGIAYEFCDEDGNGYNTKSAFSEKNPTVTPTYYWRPSNVPSGLFDKLDGFAQVFIDKPTVAYEPGDLWYIRTNEYSAETFYNVTGVTSGSCLVCVSGNTNSTPLTNFQFTDWATLEYADVAQVNNLTLRFGEFGSDNLLTPAEIKVLKEEWERVKNEIQNQTLIHLAQNPPVSMTSGETQDYYDALIKAQYAYEYFTNTQHATGGTNSDCIIIPTKNLTISHGNTSISYNYDSIVAYYIEKQKLNEAINLVIGNNANNISKQLVSWGNDNLISPIERKMLSTQYETFKEEHKVIQEIINLYNLDIPDDQYVSVPQDENEDGSLNPPSDATTGNTKEYTTLPTSKDSNFKYIQIGDRYYIWQDSYQVAYKKADAAFQYFTNTQHATGGTKSDCIEIPKVNITSGDISFNYSSITHYYDVKEQIKNRYNKVKHEIEVNFNVGLSAITATVEQHTKTISGNTDQISKLNVSYSGISAQVAQNTSDISGNTSQIGALNVSYNEITSNVTDIQNRLSGITTQVSQIEQKADKIELSVSSMSVGGVNILDRTDFESISAITSSNTDSTKFEILNRNLTNVSSSIKDGLSNADSKILVITAQNGVSNTTSENYVDVIQKVTGKLKSNTAYTLHCKYKPSYKQHESNQKTVAGALYLTNTTPASMEVNGNEITPVPSDLCVDLSGDTDSWNSVVLKFKTGTLSANTSNMFFIRTFIGSNIELCNLKLEEGNIPTAWSKSPKDISSDMSSKISQSGFITSASASTMYSQLINKDNNIVKKADISTLVENEISKATIRADQVTICGETIFNDNIKISKNGTLEATNGNFSGSISANTGYFKGDITVNNIKYNCNMIDNDGNLISSMIKGAGDFILPHLNEYEVMRITAFFPLLTRGYGIQQIIAYSDENGNDIIIDGSLETEFRCKSISNHGWLELVGENSNGQTTWYYNIISGGVTILSYYSGNTVKEGSPYPENPIKYSYIWFYIKITDERGTRVEHYTAYEGTTWESWVQTTFNYGNYIKQGNSIVYKGTSESIYNGTTTVKATDQIINTNMYSIYISY